MVSMGLLRGPCGVSGVLWAPVRVLWDPCGGVGGQGQVQRWNAEDQGLGFRVLAMLVERAHKSHGQRQWVCTIVKM